ncbi:DUF2017 family protein [Pseudonocardiaceae bacterium YIM PH 21723]|nr:DUF2017 family protein [Pseudonocardiaceae bacterium YIM PH 21723]
MICWDRTDQLVVGAFKPIHLRWLRAQLTGFRDLVDWRTKQYRPTEFGLRLPDRPTEDQRLCAVLRTYLPAEDPEPVRLWAEPEVMTDLRAGIEDVLASLPRRGGIVQLKDKHEVRNWIAVLLDLRTAYAITTGVPEALDCPLPADLAEDDPRRAPCALTWWLRDVVNGLTEIVGLTPVV